MTTRYVQLQPPPGGQLEGNPGVAAGEDSPEQAIITALRGIFDPELPVNIYDLGLIYNIDISNSEVTQIRMTLTSPGCPVAGSMPGQVECAVRAVPGVTDVRVELVWDPPWSKECLDEMTRLELGLL